MSPASDHRFGQVAALGVAEARHAVSRRTASRSCRPKSCRRRASPESVCAGRHEILIRYFNSCARHASSAAGPAVLLHCRANPGASLRGSQSRHARALVGRSTKLNPGPERRMTMAPFPSRIEQRTGCVFSARTSRDQAGVRIDRCSPTHVIGFAHVGVAWQVFTAGHAYCASAGREVREERSDAIARNGSTIGCVYWPDTSRACAEAEQAFR